MIGRSEKFNHLQKDLSFIRTLTYASSRRTRSKVRKFQIAKTQYRIHELKEALLDNEATSSTDESSPLS